MRSLVIPHLRNVFLQAVHRASAVRAARLPPTTSDPPGGEGLVLDLTMAGVLTDVVFTPGTGGKSSVMNTPLPGVLGVESVMWK